MSPETPADLPTRRSPDSLCQRPGLLRFPTELPIANVVRATDPQALRVLLLEDDVQVSRILHRLFEKMGHRPFAAFRGEEALRLLEDEEFHLAMVDIDLPDTTGFKVVAQALAQGRLQNTKIIFCSGNPSMERTALAGQFPGSSFISKPFQIQDLFNLIKQLFQSCKQ